MGYTIFDHLSDIVETKEQAEDIIAYLSQEWDIKALERDEK